jgi:hypothetical protein
MPDEYADLKAWLGSRKKCVGFKSGPSEDGGHMVCEAQFEPDPKAQEALAAFEALQARVAELEAENARLRTVQVEQDYGFGKCECGMTGPCMWDQCKSPVLRALTEGDDK